MAITSGTECCWTKWVVFCCDLHDCSLHPFTTLSPHNRESCFHWSNVSIYSALPGAVGRWQTSCMYMYSVYQSVCTCTCVYMVTQTWIGFYELVKNGCLWHCGSTVHVATWYRSLTSCFMVNLISWQVSSTPSSLLVGWATPECNGEPITAYHIELSGGHMTNHMIKVDTTQTQFTIANLKPSTLYRFVNNTCNVNDILVHVRV